jgi:hypothetical protein
MNYGQLFGLWLTINYVVAALLFIFAKDVPRSVYFLSAAVLNTTVVFFIK